MLEVRAESTHANAQPGKLLQDPKKNKEKRERHKKKVDVLMQPKRIRFTYVCTHTRAQLTTCRSQGITSERWCVIVLNGIVAAARANRQQFSVQAQAPISIHLLRIHSSATESIFDH